MCTHTRKRDISKYQINSYNRIFIYECRSFQGMNFDVVGLFYHLFIDIRVQHLKPKCSKKKRRFTLPCFGELSTMTLVTDGDDDDDGDDAM